MRSFVEQNIYYLNMKELGLLTKKLSIPIHILIEKSKDHFIKSNQVERKIFIIKKLLKWFHTGTIAKPMVYKSSVVNHNVLNKVSEQDRVYWGQFNSTNKLILSLLKKLTYGAFKHGAQSFILIETFWRNGKTPTFKQYANLWLRMKASPHPEWKYLDDLKKHKDMADWKVYRRQQAHKVIVQLMAQHNTAVPLGTKT